MSTEYSDGTVLLSINRVYYSEEGEPKYYGGEASQFFGNSTSNLQRELDKVQIAFTKPILWADHRFPEEYKPQTK